MSRISNTHYITYYYKGIQIRIDLKKDEKMNIKIKSIKYKITV